MSTDRMGTTEDLIAALRAAGHDDDDPIVTVCQGPPRCELRGDEAEAAMRAGCPFCTRITVHADGTETTSAPGEA